MSHGLPNPPLEPHAQDSLTCLAPQFKEAVLDVIIDLTKQGYKGVRALETCRSDERQAWLFGFGREWDDGRGVVTYAPTGKYSWHRYGLAADITCDNPTGAFYRDLEKSAVARGLVSGSDWRRKDEPHVQWGKCRVTPSDLSEQLMNQGGNSAVWKAVGAA